MLPFTKNDIPSSYLYVETSLHTNKITELISMQFMLLILHYGTNTVGAVIYVETMA